MNTSAPKKRSRLVILVIILGSLSLCAVTGLIQVNKIMHPCDDRPKSLSNPPLPPGAEQVAAGTPNFKPEFREAKELHFETTAKPEDVYNFYKETLARDGWSNEEAYPGYTHLPGGVQLSPGSASASFNWGCGFESRGVWAIQRLYAQVLNSGKTRVTLNYDYIP